MTQQKAYFTLIDNLGEQYKGEIIRPCYTASNVLSDEEWKNEVSKVYNVPQDKILIYDHKTF